jgi:hypothetical protein
VGNCWNLRLHHQQSRLSAPDHLQLAASPRVEPTTVCDNWTCMASEEIGDARELYVQGACGLRSHRSHEHLQTAWQLLGVASEQAVEIPWVAER